MAIAKMQKLNLVAMAYDTESVLDALQRTGAAEIKLCNVAEISPSCVDSEDEKYALERAEKCLALLEAQVSSYAKLNKLPYDNKAKAELSLSEFMAMSQKKDEMLALIAQIEQLEEQKSPILSEIARCKKLTEQAMPYKTVNRAFSSFEGTRHTETVFGVMPKSEQNNSKWTAFEQSVGLVDKTIFAQTADAEVSEINYHKSVDGEVLAMLGELGFTACPFTDGRTGEELYGDLLAETQALNDRLAENAKSMYDLKDSISALKVYCDYLAYSLEKSEAEGLMCRTEHTVMLEAYVPEESKQAVVESLESVSRALYVDFLPIDDDEEPPILLKNGKAVKNFEFITNMYSAPSYREFDPNGIMAVFYSIFLGFIIGDAGYGIAMLVGGLFVYCKQKYQTGLKSLSGVFALGGIFAIVWGLLFNSLFGISVLPVTVMPDPVSSMWSLAGISIPSVLIICMMMGLLHLFAGYLCKFWQLARLGMVFDGICEGFTWAVFSLGLELIIFGVVQELGGLTILVYVGAIMSISGLVIAMLTAGRKEKFIGKLTKGFGAVYGIINIVSDILSYARLYGLMLSGAVLAGLISDYAIGFAQQGVIGIVGAVALMLVGHIANIAISLLGAYIHDSRLQYVEFYGKFYGGDGKLFSPLGRTQKHVIITD